MLYTLFYYTIYGISLLRDALPHLALIWPAALSQGMSAASGDGPKAVTFSLAWPTSLENVEHMTSSTACLIAFTAVSTVAIIEEGCRAGKRPWTTP